MSTLPSSTAPQSLAPERLLVLHAEGVFVALAAEGERLERAVLRDRWDVQRLAHRTPGWHARVAMMHLSPRHRTLFVWEGIPGADAGDRRAYFGHGTLHMVQTVEQHVLRHGEVRWGVPLPTVRIPFLRLYLIENVPRWNHLPPMIARIFASDVEPTWSDLLFVLGFSPGQTTRILAGARRASAFVPFGAELLHGPNAALLTSTTTCQGCKVAVGEQHLATCPARECVRCGEHNLSAGETCAACLKTLPTLVARSAEARAASHDKPTVLSERCRMWWSRILGQGWRPNRRIRTMGYDGAAHFYGVSVWEYLSILAPLLAHLEGRSIAFHGAEFGLDLPAV